MAFFYSPKVIGGRDSKFAVAGDESEMEQKQFKLNNLSWSKFGPDLFLRALILKYV